MVRTAVPGLALAAASLILLVPALLVLPFGGRPASAASVTHAQAEVSAKACDSKVSRSCVSPGGDFGFSDALSKSFAAQQGSSSAKASQKTTISKVGSAITSIVTKGSTSAIQTSGSNIGDRQASNTSLFDITLDLASEQTVTLTGTVSASKSASVGPFAQCPYALVGISGIKYVIAQDEDPECEKIYPTSDGKSVPVHETFGLAAGSYHFQATARSMALARFPATTSASWNVVLSFECGMMLTTDYTLTRDLSCPGDGFTIGADGIVLNLGGHTLSGDRDSADTGIENIDGHDDVKIKNGTVSGFGEGVFMAEASRNNVSHLLIENNELNGLSLMDSDDTVVSDVVSRVNTNGFVLGGSTATTFDGTWAEGNEAYGYVLGQPGHPASNNKMLTDLSSANGFGGVLLQDGSTGNTLRDLSVFENEDDGIILDGAPTNVLVNNTIKKNKGDGITLENQANNNTLTSNDVRKNDKSGIVVDTSSSNRLTGNEVLANNLFGITVLTDGSDPFQVSGNVLTSNAAKNNVLDGIQLTHANGLELNTNHSTGNGGAGFSFEFSDANVAGLAGDNVASQNDGDGYLIKEGVANGLVNNVAAENGGFGFHFDGGSENGLETSKARANHLSGVRIEATSTMNTLKHNHSNSNKQFGYSDSSTSTTGSDNRGFRNALGLCDVPPGATFCG